MDINKPRFELTSIYSDGTAEKPQIVPINDMPWDTNTNRRGFLGTGLVAGAALVLLTNCKKKNDETSSDIFYDPFIRAHCNSTNALAISPDGKILASGSNDRLVKLWSLPDGKLLKTINGHSGIITALAINPAGNILVSGSDDRTIKLWSLPDGNLLRTLTGDSDIYSLAINPAGNILASTAYQGSVYVIKLWSLPDGNLIKTLANGSRSYSLAINPAGNILASAAYQGGVDMIKLWSLPDGNLLKTLIGHSGIVQALSINPAGSILASGSHDKTIKLWSLPDGNLLKTLTGNSELILSLSNSPDGNMLISGSRSTFPQSNAAIKLWTLPDGDLLTTLSGNTNSIFSLSTRPDGKILASGLESGEIRLWNLPKKEAIGFLFEPSCTERKVQTYNAFDSATGFTLTYTIPCGSAIPSGASCTCNCVSGTKPPPSGGGGGGGTCTCNTVCTCVPVCQAHKLLHPDKFVRILSREILLFMGIKEMDYMNWAADNSKARLRTAITSVIKKISRGVKPNYQNWPAIKECQQYLHHEDEVVSVMAAQMINLQSHLAGQIIPEDISFKVDALIIRSEGMHWNKRASKQTFYRRL